MRFLKLGAAFLMAAFFLSNSALAKGAADMKSPPFDEQAADLALDQDIYYLDGLRDTLTFMDRLLAKKSSSYNAKNQEAWLKTLPSDHEEARKAYKQRVFTILAVPENRKAIAEFIFENQAIPGIPPLSKEDKIRVLILCLEQYAVDNKLVLNGEDGDKIAKDFLYWLVQESVLHQLNKTDALLVWNLGNGAHNSSYCVWAISIKGGKFTAKQLNIPTFNSVEGLVENHYTITALGSTYDPKSQRLVFTSSYGTANFYGKIRQFYQVSKDKLILKESSDVVKFQEIQ